MKHNYEYLYFSIRIARAAIGSSEKITQEIKWKTPDTLIKLPTFEGSPTTKEKSYEEITREIIKRNKFDSISVTNYDSSLPKVRYIYGLGGMTFGELEAISDQDSPTAVLFTSLRNKSGSRTAVCLFGSSTNYTEHVTHAGSTDSPPSAWTSSARMGVERFLRQRCERGNSHYTREELAAEAFKIAYCNYSTGSLIPWNRGHMFGHSEEKVDWFARLHWSVSLEHPIKRDGAEYNQIILGAPVWARNPSGSVLRYNESTEKELERRFRKELSPIDRIRYTLQRKSHHFYGRYETGEYSID
ncbi:hypothetical protein ABZ644_07765 [Nocardiopsis alba]|uniref:hypothetical protein n=1 Tax=Nocardiopsis alba TaxID=53437 RepID=UPI0033E49B5E